MSEDPDTSHAPHPDEPVADEAGVAAHRPHPDQPTDEVKEQNEIADTGSELSFPTSDPPATWAGSDDA